MLMLNVSEFFENHLYDYVIMRYLNPANHFLLKKGGKKKSQKEKEISVQ